MVRASRHWLAVVWCTAGVAVAAPAAHGIDKSGMDTQVAPGNDFFGYANGSWLKATDIPADQSSWGVFNTLHEQTLGQTRELIENLAKGQVADYYASYLDEAAIEAKGLAPLKAELDRVAAITDKASLARLLGSSLRADVDPLNATNFFTEHLFGLWVSPAFSDPTHDAAYLLQGGLGLPDRDYYLVDNPKMAEIRVAYRAHVSAVLKLAGVAQPDAAAARIVDLETSIARVHVTRTDSEDVLKANNPWTREDFPKKAPGMDWAAYFGGAGLDKTPTFIVWHPSAVTGIAALVGSVSNDVWKDYLTYHLVNSLSGLLPKAFVDERFAFYGKRLTGTPKLQERWKRAVASTNGALPDAVGQLYVARHFTPEAKAKIQTLVSSIIDAFATRIDKLDWMTPQTREKAKDKVRALYVGVGYPETWQDYSGLRVVRGDALGNALRASSFDYQQRVSKIGGPADLHEWAMSPQTVNAVNLPLQNALNFPAAILQPPFFDPAADPVVNYGAIGAVIGHEISHSFDDQGAEFDAHGKLANWWTPEDMAHFKASAARLVAQYDAYHPFPDVAVKGQLTISENIADLAGLAASHDAWAAKAGAPHASGGLTPEQQFFLSFAQSWRTKIREPAARQRLLTDGHAPAAFRAATVRNIDAWYKAFNVKPGQALYLAPADRVHVW
jgi:putative endopeptidase